MYAFNVTFSMEVITTLLMDYVCVKYYFCGLALAYITDLTLNVLWATYGVQVLFSFTVRRHIDADFLDCTYCAPVDMRGLLCDKYSSKTLSHIRYMTHSYQCMNLQIRIIQEVFCNTMSNSSEIFTKGSSSPALIVSILFLRTASPKC